MSHCFYERQLDSTEQVSAHAPTVSVYIKIIKGIHTREAFLPFCEIAAIRSS